MEKIVVYCMAYDAGDGCIGAKWFLTEDEIIIEEGDPNVMMVETYVGSNAHKAAFENTYIKD